MAKSEHDKFERVTLEMIERIEGSIKDGDTLAPWRKPWAWIPQMNLDGRPYGSSLAQLILGLTAQEKGFGGRWLTFARFRRLVKETATDAGATVTMERGTKSTYIIWWYAGDAKNPDGSPALASDGTRKKFFAPSGAAVFNTDQLDGFVAPDSWGADPAPIADLDAAVERFLEAADVKLSHGGDRAAFRPSERRIMMPPKRAFESAEGYYATLLHECAHATGADLGRTFGKSFGDEPYAKEELIAEMTAAILSSHFGIDPGADHSAAYVGGWLKPLQNEPRFLYDAAAAASKAAKFFLEGETSPVNDPTTAALLAA
jgi:antirestriction protein ArdC